MTGLLAARRHLGESDENTARSGVGPASEPVEGAAQTATAALESGPPAAESVLPSVQCQLPPAVPELVGRADVVAAIVEGLDASRPYGARVAVLSGPPGVGKSAAAIHVAHALREQFPDGQWYVHLGGGHTPRENREVLAGLLRSAGVPGSAIPPDVADRAALRRATVADRRVLIVLDDAASLEQVEPLVPGTPECGVLVTSRRRLAGPAGAAHVRIGPLPEDASVELLTTMLGRERVEAEPGAARGVAAACGGIPLAVCIAGARLLSRPEATIDSFVRRLEDDSARLSELAAGNVGMRASLQLSYQTLDRRAQAAFRYFALVSQRECPAWQLAVLIGDDDGELLAERLVEANLLEPYGRDAAGEPRYRMHDLIADYARELLVADDPHAVTAAEHRLVGAYLQLVLTARSQWRLAADEMPPEYPGSPPRVLPPHEANRLTRDADTWLVADYRHLVDAVYRAIALGRVTDAALLADIVVPNLDNAGQWEHAVALRDLIAQAATERDDEWTAYRAYYGRAHALGVRGKSSEARAGFAACVRAFARLGAPRELALSLAGLALNRVLAAEPRLARRLAERALRSARAADDVFAETRALGILGVTLLALHEYAEALQVLHDGLARARQLPRYDGTAQILALIGRCELQLGNAAKARAACEEALVVLDPTENHHQAWILQVISEVESAAGCYQAAIAHAERSRRILRQVGGRRGEGMAVLALGRAWLAAGDLDQAIRLFEQAEAAFRDAGVAHRRREAMWALDEARRRRTQEERDAEDGEPPTA